MGKRAAVNVVLEGAQFRWELGLLWFENPGDAGIDGEWIDAEVKLVSDCAGSWSAKRETDVLTSELVAFQDALSALLSTKTGTAVLETLEDETGLTITADPERPGEYEVDAFVVCHTSPELRMREMRTGERELRSTLHGLREATALFPVQGRPEDGE